MALLVVKDLARIVDNEYIFRDVTFTLDRHDILCIVAPSGAGKTSVLKVGDITFHRIITTPWVTHLAVSSRIELSRGDSFAQQPGRGTDRHSTMENQSSIRSPARGINEGHAVAVLGNYHKIQGSIRLSV